MGKYSVLDHGIVPTFGRADLEQNISPYRPPSHAIIQCVMMLDTINKIK